MNLGYGVLIRNARKNANLSQEELGGEISVARTTICSWEKEKYPPTDARNIASLEKSLGIESGKLYKLIYAGNINLNKNKTDFNLTNLAQLFAWLTRWVSELNEQVDDGHEVMGILLDFDDPSKWTQETRRLKKYIKDGAPRLKQLAEAMACVPEDDGELEKTA